MPNKNEAQWNAMLNRLAERDGSIELSRGVSNDDTAVVIYRSRVFEIMPDGCIIVEKPIHLVQDHSLKIGDDLDLSLMLDNDRMVATCTLHEMISYELNETTRLTCYRLSPGRRPMREQRRSNFRVSVAALDLKPSQLNSDINDDPFECKVHVVNFSAGGMGVSIRATREVLNQIKHTRQFKCTAWLSEAEQIQVPVRVVHISALDHDGLYLGLKFEHANESDAKQHEKLIQQRCTEIQRMQLSRRRA